MEYVVKYCTVYMYGIVYILKNKVSRVGQSDKSERAKERRAKSERAKEQRVKEQKRKE